MKKLMSFFFALSVSFFSYSQTEIPSFGKPLLSELQMKECPFEKEASSMKLLDYQETEINLSGTGYNIWMQIERRVRIKIFSKDGVDAANITIPYIRRNNKSKITDIAAYIYNLDSTGSGIITQKLEKNQLFKEKSKDGTSTVSFTFPNVKPGSVLEYRYTYNQKNLFHLDPWFFQDKLPTALSVWKFIYPTSLRFDYRFITIDSVAKEYVNKGAKNIRTFTLKNIYSFRAEPMMSSIKDNLQRVEFAFLPPLSTSDLLFAGRNRWGAYNRALLIAPFFGEQMHINIPVTESILDSAGKIKKLEDKIHFISEKVKSIINWDGTLSFYADDLNEVWKSKTGNSAEVNLSLLNLLLRAGIRAYPILVSTRSNGRPDPEFTSLGQFNSIDVLAGDSSGFHVIDATQKYLHYKTTPYNVLNRNAFLVDTLNFTWINVTDDRPLMKTNVNVNAELTKDGILAGNARLSYYDHSKAERLEEENKKEDESDKEFFEKEAADIKIDSFSEENLNNESLPLIHKFKFTYKLSTTGDYFLIDPFFLSSLRKNPFIDSLRRTDIDMGSNQSYAMSMSFKITDDYIIEELPKNILVRSIDSSMLFKREIFRDGNTIVFRNSFDIQRPIYAKEEYVGIKEYFKKIYDVISDRIVLKKKK